MKPSVGLNMNLSKDIPFFIEFSCTFYDERYSCLLNWNKIHVTIDRSKNKVKTVKNNFNMRQFGIMEMLSKCFFVRVCYLRFIKMVSI